MKRTNIIVVALALGGCTPDQDTAQCEVEAIRLYPNNPPKVYDDVASRYAIACMKAKGYDFSPLPKEDCWAFRGSHATQPGCYKSTGWLARVIGRKND
jgi:hypothetical protein